MNRNEFNLLQSIYQIILTIYLTFLIQLVNKLRWQSFANEKEISFIFLLGSTHILQPILVTILIQLHISNGSFGLLFFVVFNLIGIGSSDHTQDILPCNASSWIQCEFFKNLYTWSAARRKRYGALPLACKISVGTLTHNSVTNKCDFSVGKNKGLWKIKNRGKNPKQNHILGVILCKWGRGELRASSQNTLGSKQNQKQIGLPQDRKNLCKLGLS